MAGTDASEYAKFQGKPVAEVKTELEKMHPGHLSAVVVSHVKIELNRIV